MKILVTVARSEDWVKARRIETGENIPAKLAVEVDTSELSHEVRMKILSYYNEYANIGRINFDSTYSPNRYAHYDYAMFYVDSLNPTAAEINQAILSAFAVIEKKRVEWVEAKKKRDAQHAIEEEENRRKREEINKARELLKDDLDKLAKAEADLLLLSEFLATMPDNALRAALKSMAKNSSRKSMRDLQKKIENAAVKFVVFDSDNDDSDDE